MKKIFLTLILLLLMFVIPAQAYYRCVPNNATNEVLYYTTIRQDGFSKFTLIEFGKTVKRDNSAVYYVIPSMPHKRGCFLSDDGGIIVDGVNYPIKKDTLSPHIEKRHRPGLLVAEYSVPLETVDKIKNSKGEIKLIFNIEGSGEKVLNYGLKTSDEIRFIANRTFEDFPAVAKKQLVPQYTEKKTD